MHTEDVVDRREGAGDISAVRGVNEAAFGRKEEADLVDRLRNEGAVMASFVAEHNGRIVGHILFSRTLIETADESARFLARHARSALSRGTCEVPNLIRRGKPSGATSHLIPELH